MSCSAIVSMTGRRRNCPCRTRYHWSNHSRRIRRLFFWASTSLWCLGAMLTALR